MRYPHDLPEDGTLGFIAPSFGASTEPYHSAFLNALDVLKSSGFQLKLGPNCFEGSGIGISNTPEACGAEANAFFTDPGVDTIISCGGGELMCTTLDFVDFDRIREAILEFRGKLRKQDRMVMVTFGDAVKKVLDGSETAEQAASVLEGIGANDSTTVLAEAVKETAAMMETAADPEKKLQTMIIISDGKPEDPKL